MKSSHWLWAAMVLVPLASAGCNGGDDGDTTEAKEYPIQGTVSAVDPGKPSVKLDHEEIPGLMKAM